MTPTSPSSQENFDPQGPHPLAVRLIAHLRAEGIDGPILEVGTGRGRNRRALEAAGFVVEALDDAVPYTQLPAARATFAAAIATHAYLHGATAKLRAGFAELARVLVPGAPAFVTLGSIDDARFGFGEEFDEATFAPGDGDEAGIPHGYYDRHGVTDVVRPFVVRDAENVDVDEIVGRWAHDDPEDIGGRRHWFCELTAPRVTATTLGG
jgi:SAM-dependent methyltransferase